jgi:hypothetical protein
MQKSTCYRLVRNDKTGASEYILIPSYLEVMKDITGKEYNIHIHKVTYPSGISEWSATEESTGLKCIDINQPTKKEALERMSKIALYMSKYLFKNIHYIEQLRRFKEKNNIK